VFIWGCPRSGTTLLKSLLVTHPALGGTLRESTGIFNIRDIFEFGLDEMSSDEMTALLSESNDIIEFYDRVADALLTQSRKTVFVDKLQPRGYRLAYVLRRFPESRFVNIVRDGRDCYCSALRHPGVAQSRSIARFAQYWQSCVGLPATLVPENRRITITYETLTSQPRVWLPRVMEFLGLDFLEQQIVVEHYAQTNNLGKVPWHQNLARPINTNSHGRWRKELTVAQNAEFCRIAESALVQHGYVLG